MSEQTEVTVVLSKQTIKHLSEIAKSQCRTINGQAEWYIVTGVEETHLLNREILKEKRLVEAENRINCDGVVKEEMEGKKLWRAWVDSYTEAEALVAALEAAAEEDE